MKELVSNHWNELGMKIERADLCFRFLVSKFIFTEEELSETDKVALFSSFERMVDKVAIDNSYAQKHQWWLFITRSLVQSLNGTISPEIRKNFSEQIKCFTSHGRGYFSASLYYGIRIKGERLYSIWIHTRFKKKIAEKSFIGVGYRDKGHLQVVHDGSQHWSEIAMALYDHESESTSERREHLWNSLSINDLQRLNGSPFNLKHR